MGSAASCNGGVVVESYQDHSVAAEETTSYNGLSESASPCRTVGQTTAASSPHSASGLGVGAGRGAIAELPRGMEGEAERPADLETGTKGETAVMRLLVLEQKLERGEVPDIKELLGTVKCAVAALSTGGARSEEDKFERIRDRQVREWLSTTFTRSDSVYESHPAGRSYITRFKAAANTIIITNYLGGIHRDLSLSSGLQFSEAVRQHLQHVDDWDFDIFELDALTGGSPLRYVGHHLLKGHNLFEKCEISANKFDSFLVKIEEGYRRHGNPYHNACHGADVAQTVHYLLHATGFEALLSNVELLSMLLAAIIHDVDHPGTSNTFQINQHTEYALLYNDRSVLENHHLHFSFTVLQEADCNFLKLSSDDFKLLRGLMIEMVLATDMSSHFDQLKHVRHIMSLPEGCTQLQGVERAKMFSLLLHQADISHPAKPWELHHEWSIRLAEEFYRQGDEERRQGLPISPLCNRNGGNLCKSQLGFIEFIVSPSFQLCGDMLKLVVPPVRGASQADQSHDVSHDPAQAVEAQISRWERCLSENKSKWEQKSQTPRVETRVVGSDITSARRKNHVLEKQQVVSESDDHTPSHTTLHDNDTGHVNTPD